MKRILLLIGFLLNIVPVIDFDNLSIGLSGNKISAQGMGDEAMCTVMCPSFNVTLPCSYATTVTCTPIVVTPDPPSNPPDPDPYPYPDPGGGYNPCDPSSPGYNPCNCGQSCGPPPGGGGTGSTTPLPDPEQDPDPDPDQDQEPPTEPEKVDCGQEGGSVTGKATYYYDQAKSYSSEDGFYSYGILKSMTSSGWPYEQGYTVQRDEWDGISMPTWSVSPLIGGTNSNVEFQTDCAYNHGRLVGTVATVHSHPPHGYAPPSPPDLYLLLEGHNTCSILQVGLTLASNGDEYMLQISNSNKAAAFLAQYPKSENIDVSTNDFKEGTGLYEDFVAARLAFENQGYTIHEAFGLAMAYVLDEYDAGVKLLKKDNDGKFKEQKAEANTVDGKDVYKGSECE